MSVLKLKSKHEKAKYIFKAFALYDMHEYRQKG